MSWTNPTSFTRDQILFGDGRKSFTLNRTNGNIFYKVDVFGTPDTQQGKCKKAEKTETLF